ncbi:hypothetical protein N7478_010533 [Penicillium angulare]|uniref:uncharacterized protein n=1 Tax=Penicillium angulare TaxID=116970 RepID=UPI0025420F63|nr:uncharacterized protein N7478_010533 [Penicillium angulare]KAJ5267725.1 hypothetical protein N7478_010533 [Penicillium angulare]
MSKTASISIKDINLIPIGSSHPTMFVYGLKKRLKALKKIWGPLMPAKEHLDDEYNFPPGRYAGQDDDNLTQPW